MQTWISIHKTFKKKNTEKESEMFKTKKSSYPKIIIKDGCPGSKHAKCPTETLKKLYNDISDMPYQHCAISQLLSTQKHKLFHLQVSKI